MQSRDLSGSLLQGPFVQNRLLVSGINYRRDSNSAGNEITRNLKMLRAELGGKPVPIFASGRLMLLTSPADSGSVPVVKTTGMEDVIALAVREALLPPVAPMTVTRYAIRSATSVLKRSGDFRRSGTQSLHSDPGGNLLHSSHAGTSPPGGSVARTVQTMNT